jgi:hypothetical protein
VDKLKGPSEVTILYGTVTGTSRLSAQRITQIIEDNICIVFFNQRWSNVDRHSYRAVSAENVELFPIRSVNLTSPLVIMHKV